MIWSGPVAEKTKGLAVKNPVFLRVKRGSDDTKWQERTGHSVQDGRMDIVRPQCNSLLLMFNVFCLSRRARPINLATKNKSCFRSCLLRNGDVFFATKIITKVSLKFHVFWWMFNVKRLHWLWIRTFKKFKRFGPFSLLQSKLLVVNSCGEDIFTLESPILCTRFLIDQARYVNRIDNVYDIEDPERIFKQSFYLFK